MDASEMASIVAKYPMSRCECGLHITSGYKVKDGDWTHSIAVCERDATDAESAS
jgi:hypothetical protein